jgi:tRNA-splicing ligase RtcB
MAKIITREMNIRVPTGLEYLPMSAGGKDYMVALRTAQRYADMNRTVMIRIMLSYFGMEYDPDRAILSVHNYISPRDNIIRKGAISAYPNERVVIPFNMAEGSIVGKGKGNRAYNYSAPHGAGRVYGRKALFRMLHDGTMSMDTFRKSMEGVFSTSVSEATFDESPAAYKQMSDVIDHIRETVDIEFRLLPIYNLKDDSKRGK